MQCLQMESRALYMLGKSTFFKREIDRERGRGRGRDTERMYAYT